MAGGNLIILSGAAKLIRRHGGILTDCLLADFSRFVIT
jgi:hypothetical protein